MQTPISVLPTLAEDTPTATKPDILPDDYHSVMAELYSSRARELKKAGLNNTPLYFFVKRGARFHSNFAK